MKITASLFSVFVGVGVGVASAGDSGLRSADQRILQDGADISGGSDCDSIADAVCNLGDQYSTMCDIVKNETAMSSMDFGTKEYTVFIPDDTAWTLFQPSMVGLSEEEVGRIVSFHFYEGIDLTYDELECGETLTAVSGDTSRTKCDQGHGDDIKHQNGNGNTIQESLPTITNSDIEFCQGVAHTIDHLMLPVHLEEFIPVGSSDDHHKDNPGKLKSSGGGGEKFIYCGGDDQTNGLAQISCSAFPVKGLLWDQDDSCNADAKWQLAHNDDTQNDALVWQDNNADDYWVFHGCDGAGLMFDIENTQWYLEHYLGTTEYEDPHDCSGYAASDCNAPWDMDACWCEHWESPFVHPGTSAIYDVWAGMWTNCGSQWADEAASKPWFSTLQQQGLKRTEEYDCDSNDVATAFVITYPWVCHGPYSDVNYYSYWGDDSNWQNGLPYGDVTYGINCYYDNEPMDSMKKGVDGSYDPHNESTMPPPVMQVYKFVKQNSDDDYITGWLIGKKDKSDTQFVDTTGGDGFVLNFNTGDIPY